MSSVVVAENEPASSSDEVTVKAFEKLEVQETFKEHYPLLLPFSYAAIVEDEKNELKYSVIEPTLTALDKRWVKEIKEYAMGRIVCQYKSS